MRYTFVAWLLLYLLPTACIAQEPPISNDLPQLPAKFIDRIQQKLSDLNANLQKGTEAYLQKATARENEIREKMRKIDPAGATALFANSDQQYSEIWKRFKADTGNQHMAVTGEYQPYTDSLKGTLLFLQQNAQLINVGNKPLSLTGDGQLQCSLAQLQMLQAKMQDADQIKAYVQQRKQVISQYIEQHTELRNLLGKQYAGMNQDLYYYSQQVRQYKEMLNDPDQLEQKALVFLNKLPAFQQFMKNNSQLADLFNLPANYGTPEALNGLQTRDQVSQLVQNQVSAGGASGAAALQSNLEAAESLLDQLKNKLSKLGSGSGDMEMPDFKPNDQKTKTFWKRLEYGTNFQTTHNNYYFPTVTDLGLSLAYKLTNANVIGVGASYKIGWGNGIDHVALSSQGVGLRSFLQIKIKSSFSATGGLEYNYTTPFTSYRHLPELQYWTQSGLLGVTKTVSLKSRVFKKTQLQLLWDFLSYQQVPQTQPILFRVGYNF